MKTLRILILGALVSITSVSFAQEQQANKELTPEMRAERMTKKMTVDLSLTKDQIAKVEAINLEIAKKREAMKAESTQDKEANKAFKAEMDAKFQTVLTPEQMTKMKELEQAKMEARKAQKPEIRETKAQTIQTEKITE